jgi:hypothetical protein
MKVFLKLINQTKEGTIAILTYRQLLVHRNCTNTQFRANIRGGKVTTPKPWYILTPNQLDLIPIQTVENKGKKLSLNNLMIPTL